MDYLVRLPAFVSGLQAWWFYPGYF